MAASDKFVFVSHVAEDREAAMQVVGELEQAGMRCWIAPRNVRPGKPFDDEIADAIENCQAMLLIFSNRCNDSEYIRREITFAGDTGKAVIPFRIEDAFPKRGLRVRLADLHWVDAFPQRENAIEEVIRVVQPLAAVATPARSDAPSIAPGSDAPVYAAQPVAATVARPTPVTRTSARAATAAPGATPPPKSSLPLILGIVGAVVVLLGGALAAVMFGPWNRPTVAPQPKAETRAEPEPPPPQAKPKAEAPPQPPQPKPHIVAQRS